MVRRKPAPQTSIDTKDFEKTCTNNFEKDFEKELDAFIEELSEEVLRQKNSKRMDLYMNILYVEVGLLWAGTIILIAVTIFKILSK